MVVAILFSLPGFRKEGGSPTPPAWPHLQPSLVQPLPVASATSASQATRVLGSPAHLLPRALISCKCKNSGQTPPEAEPPPGGNP